MRRVSAQIDHLHDVDLRYAAKSAPGDAARGTVAAAPVYVADTGCTSTAPFPGFGCGTIQTRRCLGSAPESDRRTSSLSNTDSLRQRQFIPPTILDRTRAVFAECGGLLLG